jgi:hypothetical protein
VTEELDVSVRVDGLGFAMQLDNFSKEEMGYMGCIKGLHARDEVCHFGKSVNYYENSVHTSLGPLSFFHQPLSHVAFFFLFFF